MTCIVYDVTGTRGRASCVRMVTSVITANNARIANTPVLRTERATPGQVVLALENFLGRDVMNLARSNVNIMSQWCAKIMATVQGVQQDTGATSARQNAWATACMVVTSPLVNVMSSTKRLVRQDIMGLFVMKNALRIAVARKDATLMVRVFLVRRPTGVFTVKKHAQACASMGVITLPGNVICVRLAITGQGANTNVPLLVKRMIAKRMENATLACRPIGADSVKTNATLSACVDVIE